MANEIFAFSAVYCSESHWLYKSMFLAGEMTPSKAKPDNKKAQPRILFGLCSESKKRERTRADNTPSGFSLDRIIVFDCFY